MRRRGQAAIQTLLLLFLTMMIGGLAVDAGLYFAIHKGMGNASDAAALAGVAELFNNDNEDLNIRFASARDKAQELANLNKGFQLHDADIDFGYVDPTNPVYDESTFTTPNLQNEAFAQTGGYNAVRVIMKANEGEANPKVPIVFSRILGIDSVPSYAMAVAIWGGGVTETSSGLRPVYMCQTAYDKALELYGDPEIPEIKFYGDHLVVGEYSFDMSETCGAFGGGNWGLADLTNVNGAPGNNEVKDWFANGYQGELTIGDMYEAEPGTPLNTYADSLDNLIENETVVTVPVFDWTDSENGSQPKFKVSMIAGFRFTEYVSTGPQAKRYLAGHFVEGICTQGCTGGNMPGTLTRLRLIR